MSSPEVLETIRGWKWFAYVPAEGQQWLAERATLRTFAKGATVFAPGDRVQSIYGVISGAFRQFATMPNGDTLTHEETVRGGWFAHMIPEPGVTHVLHCVAQQDSRVVVVPWKAALELGEQWPQFFRGVYHEFMLRGHAILGRLELLTAHGIKVRLAVYLLRMATIRGQREANGSIWVASEDSQSELGARIGGARQRVNLALKDFARRKLIELKRDGIRVLDIEALKREGRKSGFDLDSYLSGWHGGWQGARKK